MKKFFKVFLSVFVVFVVALISLYVFRNPIVDAVIEKLGTVAAGAKVEVDGVKTFPVEGRIKWDKIQVADKDDTWKNLFETGKCEFELEYRPLVAGKIIVDTLSAYDIKTGTARTTDGKVQKTLKSKSENAKPSWIKQYALKQLEKEKEAIPVLNPGIFDREVDADAIIAELALITPGNVERLQSFTEERYNYWETKLEKSNYETRIKDLRKEIESIKLNKIKTISDFQKNISKAEKIIKKTKSLRKEITTEKKQFDNDIKKIRVSAKQIPVWIKTDYETALKKAQLTDFSAENISRLLFGDRVSSIMMMALETIEKSRELLKGQPSSLKMDEKEKMPTLPKVWIRKINLTTTLQNGFILKGIVNDVSSNQQRTGRPIVIALEGQSDRTGIVKINGVMDYRTAILSDVFNVTVRKYPIKDVKIAEASIFPEKIKKGNYNFSAGLTVKNNSLDSKIEFQLSDVVFDYSTIKNPKTKAAQIAKNAAEKMDEIVVYGSVRAKDESLHINLDSNIDEVISAEIKRMITGEIEQGKVDLKKKLDKKLGNYPGDFAKKTGGKEKELSKVWGFLDKDSAGQVALIDSKKKRLEKKLKKKVKKAEKDLIKKLKIKF